jgi:hypothetical protein
MLSSVSECYPLDRYSMLSSVSECYPLGLYVILWIGMLSSVSECYPLGLYVILCARFVVLPLNVIIWDDTLPILFIY